MATRASTVSDAAPDLHRRYSARRRRFPVLPLAIIGLIIFSAIFAEWIVPHEPTVARLSDRLIPPFSTEGGSMNYILGTDHLGRDILSRMILGARVSLIVALSATFLGGVVGTFLGLLAANSGKIVDAVIMRTADAFLAFPTILLALLFAIVLGPSLQTVIIILGLVTWARFARLVRGEALSVKTRDYVSLAKVAGCSPRWIIIKHLLPNVANTVVVMATLLVGWAILSEAALSFLGAGVPPPAPSWGSMVADGRGHLAAAWWISTIPGFAIMLTVLSLNLLGDWIRDTLDPRLRQV